MKQSEKTGHAVRSKRRDWLIYAFIAGLMLALLMLFSGKKSFFSDEMDQLGILSSVQSLPELLRLYASVGHEVAPPLFAVLAWCWYQFVPYGQSFLQLLPALLTCAGVYLTGLAGRAAGGRLAGFFAAVLALIAPALSLTAGMQLRQYGALFFFSALTTYLYVLRNTCRGKEKWSVLILYGVAMAALPYTHYISVLLPVGFFLIDAVLLLGKRIRARCLVSYAIGGGLFLPWALSILRSVAARNEFWIDKPRVSDLLEALYFLTDGNRGGVLFYLFLLGCCALVAGVLSARLRREPPRMDLGFLCMLACVPFFMIGCVFVYSAYLSANISLFLPRYFISAIPVLLIVASYAAVRLLRLMTAACGPKAFQSAALAACLFAAAFCVIRLEGTVRADVGAITEPYREAADYLCDRADIRDGSAAVVTSNLSGYVTKGWETYYVTRGGERASFPIYDYVRIPTEDDAARYGVLYAFVEHAALPPATQALLDAYYELDASSTDGLPWRVTRYVRRADAR